MIFPDITLLNLYFSIYPSANKDMFLHDLNKKPALLKCFDGISDTRVFILLYALDENYL